MNDKKQSNMEAKENEEKAKTVFLKYREDDIKKYEAQISELQKENEVI